MKKVREEDAREGLRIRLRIGNQVRVDSLRVSMGTLMCMGRSILVRSGVPTPATTQPSPQTVQWSLAYPEPTVDDSGVG